MGDSAPHFYPNSKPHAPPLINGHSSLVPTEVLRKDDREQAIHAIQDSFQQKHLVNFDEVESHQDKGEHSHRSRDRLESQQYEEVGDDEIEHLGHALSINPYLPFTKTAARDTRDAALPTPLPSARSSSPFTASPMIDFEGLSWPSAGTLERLREQNAPGDAQLRLKKLAGAVRTILECIGEDPEREGLKETPDRYAKALMYFTKGYEENLRDIVNGAVFNENHDELVIVKDIDVYSLCEHHLVPFTGKIHIGYIPSRRVIGLSKLARIAEMFSRRLQVQERLTKQIALALNDVLKAQGVAVVMESSHMCMVMRGVQKVSAVTTTSCMLGAMRTRAKTREEFLSLLNRR